MRSGDSQDHQDDKLDVILSEMKSMFSEFKERQERQDAKIEKIYEDIKKQNTDIQTSLEFMSHKYDSIVVQINQIESERKNDKKYIEELENKLEKIERNSRSACLEVRNIPGSTSETKQTLLKTIISLGEALSVTLQPLEIKDIFRLKPKEPSSHRTIIVEFTSVLLKERIIQSYKRLNKTYRLTTETLKISGPATPIFISENLSAKMKRLFYLSREFAKLHNYRYCWVSNGKIFLREKDGATLKLISSENDLELLQNKP